MGDARDAEFLWTYARAYRETGDDRLWQMVRAIAHGNGLGDVGAIPPASARSWRRRA